MRPHLSHAILAFKDTVEENNNNSRSASPQRASEHSVLRAASV